MPILRVFGAYSIAAQPPQNDHLVADLRKTAMVAPMMLDGPINGDWFDANVSHITVPHSRLGDIVIMDSEHRAKSPLRCVT